MSAFIAKPNTGTLWPNDKTASNQPDMKGDAVIDRTLLQDLIDKSEGDLVKIQIACWEKVIGSKNCLSLKVSAPYVKNESAPRRAPPRPPADSNEDMPF
jgi:hypothetical protein